MRLRALPEIEFESEWDETSYEYMASYIVQPSLQWDCQGIVNATDPVFSTRVEEIKKELLEKYKDTVFRPEIARNAPVRGPHCEATITLIPDAVPKAQKCFQMVGDRRKGMIDFINRLLKEDKIETSLSEWSSPAFVVPKKKPGDWRLVID